MPVDRDDHRRPLASTEGFHDFRRDLQPFHGLRGLDVCSKLHVSSSGPVSSLHVSGSELSQLPVAAGVGRVVDTPLVAYPRSCALLSMLGALWIRLLPAPADTLLDLN